MTEKEKRRFNQMADADKKVRAFVNSAMIGEKISVKQNPASNLQNGL